MNILVVSCGYPSKKYPLHGIFEMDQAKALQAAGQNLVFAVVDLRSIRRWRKWGYEFCEKDGVEVCAINIPVGAVPKKILYFIGNWAFGRLYRRISKKYGKPDVVHAHFGGTAHSVVKTCKEKGIPYVVTEHSSEVNRDDLTEAEIAPMRYVYRNAAAVIAVSGALANRIEKYSGIKPVVIPNIVDFSSFSIAPLKHNGFRFVSAANLNEGKGFDVLLAAFHKCISVGMMAELLIMGDGPERESLYSLVEKYGLTERVRFFGRYVRPQFAEELSKSDVFVLASRGETFGVVYAEAMASGVPVIATRCGGPEDFVDETNGILVNVNDVDGLAKAMVMMYENIDKYDAKKIISHAKQIFSSEHIADKLTQVFEMVLHKETK